MLFCKSVFPCFELHVLYFAKKRPFSATQQQQSVDMKAERASICTTHKWQKCESIIKWEIQNGPAPFYLTDAEEKLTRLHSHINANTNSSFIFFISSFLFESYIWSLMIILFLFEITEDVLKFFFYFFLKFSHVILYIMSYFITQVIFYNNNQHLNHRHRSNFQAL